MRTHQIVPKNPLQAQAQMLRKRATTLSNTAKQQNAAQRTQKAAVAHANANKAESALRQKLQTPTSKPGTNECRLQQRGACKSVSQNITDPQSRANSFGSAQEKEGKTQ